MSIYKKLSPGEFDHMINYPVYTNDPKQLNKMKTDFLDASIKAFGKHKYSRLKEGSRKVIERICITAADRGFFYIKRKDFLSRNHISDKTLRNIMATLREAGVIVTIYQGSLTHNGRGEPIHLFIDHPYFSYWRDSLDLQEYLTRNEKDCEL
ncbi:hypothetical protein [Domibacillus robiginosus]|uniref:hypothetical protein n=1 Tax=Domibacillus robiginosus TaxID=1071054 RepID=UPI00067BF9E1|nr:hypothetical protein [Domibacillus robiginosus]